MSCTCHFANPNDSYKRTAIVYSILRSFFRISFKINYDTSISIIIMELFWMELCSMNQFTLERIIFVV